MAHRKTTISQHEWDLLEKLTSKAKMDWFFDATTIRKSVKNSNCIECTPKGYLTSSQANCSACAFIVPNFCGFTADELQEIRDCFVRCGIKADFLDCELEEWKKGKVS